jgi:hypothetical protein
MVWGTGVVQYFKKIFHRGLKDRYTITKENLFDDDSIKKPDKLKAVDHNRFAGHPWKIGCKHFTNDQ